MTLEERNKLIEDNIPLALYITQRYRHRSFTFEYDDAISIAYMGLIKAADNYQPNNKCKFSSYAATCMVREFKREYDVRHRKRDVPDSVVFSMESKVMDTENLTVADSLMMMGFEDDVLNSIIAQEALSYVKGKRLDALVRHFLNGERVIDIAQSRGVSHQAVDSMIKCATAAIHRKMCKRYGEAVQNDI